jgi:FkbM family methyltransferase
MVAAGKRKSVMRWLRRGKQHKEEAPFDIATETDIYYCYRLLLRREPDEGGYKYWRKWIRNHPITLQRLVDGFMGSEEYRNLQASAGQPVLVEREGFKMYVRPNDYATGVIIASGQIYEPHVTAELRRRLGPGMTFVDVGANVGYFALLAATLVGPQGKVIAFEPNLDNCELFRRSIAASGFAEQVHLHPYAAAEKAQTFVLDVGGNDSNGRMIDFSAEAVAGINPPRTIQAVALDDLLAGESRLDVVKMDIEGAEPRALRGMAQVIRKHRPLLLLEFSPFLIQVTSHMAAADFLEELAAFDYELSILTEAGEGSEGGQSPATILEIANQPERTHVDIVAYPKKG